MMGSGKNPGAGGLLKNRVFVDPLPTNSITIDLGQG